MSSVKPKKNSNPNRFYGYKHWTLEESPRCLYVGKGRGGRPHSHIQRNHKWHAIVKRYGLRVEICIGPITNEEVCVWEIANIASESTFTIDHSHDSEDIGCNFTKGGDTGATGYRWTEERRQRQSTKTKGRIGHFQTEETRRKIGLASKCRRASLKTREKIRQATSRENLSSETRRKRSESASKRTLKMTMDGNVVEIFTSMQAAAKSVNGTKGKLCTAIKNQRQYKGFMWKYV